MNNDIDVEELEYELTNSYFIDEDDVDDLPDIERRFLEEQSHRLPPVPEGKIVSVNMVNFARDVTKAYRLCVSFSLCTMSTNLHNCLSIF